MRILLQSSAFSPSVGGTETATRLLALGLKELGHEVRVVTETPGESLPDLEILRDVSAWRWWRLVRWCEVLLQSDVNPRGVSSMHLFRRLWSLLHRDGLEMKDPTEPTIPLDAPYDEGTFRPQPGTVRDTEFIVAGRLVDENGTHIAIEALALLHQRGYSKTRLTIVGEGTSRDQLTRLVAERGLGAAVIFNHFQTPVELAATLNRHHILIVPALTATTFGIGALEGMACGCLVVVSDVGSLRYKVGSAGLTFPAGNVEALANILQIHLDRPAAKESFLRAASAHLASFTRNALIPVYAQHLQVALERRKGKA